MKVKSNSRYSLIIIFCLIVSILFSACGSKIPDSRQDLKKGIVEFEGRQYAPEYHIRLNENSNDRNGLNNDNFTLLANINNSGLYSIKGLDPEDWIYFNYGDCDVGFGLCKNVATTLDGKYYEFSDNLQILKYNYTIEEGSKKVLDAMIENKAMVSFAYNIASSDGNSDLGVTSDKITAYSLLLTPKAYPALQYYIGYFECENGYFIESNKSRNGPIACIKVDDAIHKLIGSLE